MPSTAMTQAYAATMDAIEQYPGMHYPAVTGWLMSKIDQAPDLETVQEYVKGIREALDDADPMDDDA